MTIEEAKRILHPDTSAEAIAEINEQNGFDREKGIEKVKEACVVACDAMDKFKWIPCSERLPEEKVSSITMDYCAYPVICNFGDGMVEIRYCYFGRGHWLYGSSEWDSVVTHWLDIYAVPLPKPYTE